MLLNLDLVWLDVKWTKIGNLTALNFLNQRFGASWYNDTNLVCQRMSSCLCILYFQIHYYVIISKPNLIRKLWLGSRVLNSIWYMKEVGSSALYSTTMSLNWLLALRIHKYITLLKALIIYTPYDYKIKVYFQSLFISKHNNNNCTVKLKILTFVYMHEFL